MRTTTRALAVLGGLAVVGALAALIAVFGGAYDVAATTPHWAVTEALLGRMQHASVGARAAEVAGSPPTDSASLARGLAAYDDMCVQCHGAPGVERGVVGQGMNPEPPSLAEEAGEWSEAELFWITKHGIRLAGMPAFGPTHDDREIWELVAAVRSLPELGPDAYGAHLEAPAADSAGPADDGHDHTH